MGNNDRYPKITEFLLEVVLQVVYFQMTENHISRLNVGQGG